MQGTPGQGGGCGAATSWDEKSQGKKNRSQLYLSASLEGEEKLRNTHADLSETKISLFIFGNVKFMAGKD